MQKKEALKIILKENEPPTCWAKQAIASPYEAEPSGGIDVSGP
jgi:hypothetical protein